MRRSTPPFRLPAEGTLAEASSGELADQPTPPLAGAAREPEVG